MRKLQSIRGNTGIPNLDPICKSENSHDLKNDTSKVWPFSDDKGVYAILHHDMVLYIGKASHQGMGYRLGSYFDKDGNPKQGHTWTEIPTHVVTWKVPEDSPFEASALEEFLIRELAPPDNER